MSISTIVRVVGPFGLRMHSGDTIAFALFHVQRDDEFHMYIVSFAHCGTDTSYLVTQGEVIQSQSCGLVHFAPHFSHSLQRADKECQPSN